MWGEGSYFLHKIFFNLELYLKTELKTEYTQFMFSIISASFSITSKNIIRISKLKSCFKSVKNYKFILKT